MLYAKQIPPEYQTSPLNYDCMPDNVILTGNRYYNEHTTELYDKIISYYGDMADEYEDIKSGCSSYYKNVTELINDYFPAYDWHGKPYSTKDIHAFKNALELYGTRDYYDGAYILDMLNVITGKRWSVDTIRGCCQGDWQGVIYPAEYGRDWLDNFEIEYFNLGSEWIIHDGDDVPEDADSISGYAIYCYSYDVRDELAQHTGEKPENIKLYEFTEYTQHAKYMEV